MKIIAYHTGDGFFNFVFKYSGLSFKKEPESSEERVKRLAKCPIGSGHDTALKLIPLVAVIQADQVFWLQWQRYHFQDPLSDIGMSESKMHSITSMECLFNMYTSADSVNYVKKLIDAYNCGKGFEVNINTVSGLRKVTTKDELFKIILATCPEGLELRVAIVTNYLQCKSVYAQRKNHKTDAWKEYCKWLETLPYAELITGKQ